MRHNLSADFLNCLGEIQHESGGTFFVNIEESSAVGGVIVKGCKYKDSRIFSAINKFKKKHKIEFKHLMIGDNIILLQFDKEN